MNRKQLVITAAAVLVAHGALFWFLADKKPLPYIEKIPPPNFSAREDVIVDEKDGQQVKLQQFRVSTKLADPRPTKEPVSNEPFPR